MPTKSRSRSATAGFAAALLLFVVGSLVAWWQPPRLFPLKPQTAAEWWLQLLEDNAFQRMPRISESLNDVLVVPKTGEVWAVGRNGLIVHSRDGGRTWEQAAIAAKADEMPLLLTRPINSRHPFVLNLSNRALRQVQGDWVFKDLNNKTDFFYR